MSVTIQTVVPCFDPLHEFSKKSTESALNAFFGRLLYYKRTSVWRHALLQSASLCSHKFEPLGKSGRNPAILPASTLQPAEVPTSASIYPALGDTVSDYARTWFLKATATDLDLKTNFKNKILTWTRQKNINRTMLMTWWSIPGESTLKNISDGSSLSLYPHQVASHCPEGGSQLKLTTYVSNVEGLWFCSISNSPDIYRGSYFQ